MTQFYIHLQVALINEITSWTKTIDKRFSFPTETRRIQKYIPTKKQNEYKPRTLALMNFFVRERERQTERHTDGETEMFCRYNTFVCDNGYTQIT